MPSGVSGKAVGPCGRWSGCRRAAGVTRGVAASVAAFLLAVGWGAGAPSSACPARVARARHSVAPRRRPVPFNGAAKLLGGSGGARDVLARRKKAHRTRKGAPRGGLAAGEDMEKANRMWDACREAARSGSIGGADKILAQWERAQRADEKRGAPVGALSAGLDMDGAGSLRAAARVLAQGLEGLRLGIMASDGSTALRALERWTAGLELPAQKLAVADVQAVGEDNQAADMSEVLAGPVYLKFTYKSRDKHPETGDEVVSESAYVKPHPHPSRGVIFHPDLPDGRMRLYGNLPLTLFGSVDGRN